MLLARIFVMLVCAASCASTYAQVKRALVVGNNEYAHTAALRNPINDAQAISGELTKLGFRVTTKTNVAFSEFRQGLVAFTDSIADRDVVFFFYAGHGIQVDDKNYLIPTDAKLDSKTDVPYETISVEVILRSLEINNPNGLNILVLDACRNNPFKSWDRGGSDGLAPVSPPSGTIIGFSTSPGSVSSDGNGTNGLYTSVLLAQIGVNQRIEDVFIQTRNEVERLSGGRQSPWELSRLRGQYFLNTAGTAAVLTTPARTEPVAKTSSVQAVSGIVKTRKTGDRDKVEVSIIQKGNVFDVVYTDNQGKFSYPISKDIELLDSIELRFSKKGMKDRSYAVFPNSRGVHIVDMERDFQPGKIEVQAKFGMAPEVNGFDTRFAGGQLLFRSGWLKQRLSLGIAVLKFTEHHTYTYETLPGYSVEENLKNELTEVTIPVRYSLFGPMQERKWNPYAEIHIPLGEILNYFSAAVGVRAKINNHLFASLEAGYFHYRYDYETTEFNPVGVANHVVKERIKNGIIPSFSLHYRFKRFRP